MIRPAETPAADVQVHWFIVRENKLLTDPQGNLPVARIDDFPQAMTAYTARIGELAEGPAYVMLWPEDEREPAGYLWTPLRQLLLSKDSEAFALAGRACQVQHFLLTHQFCGRCGHRTEEVQHELAVSCPACEFVSYPRISPCIIVAIYQGREILLARGSRHPEGLFSVLAGFVESGESLEQALHREVFEEAGIQVTDLRYRFSQPWPFPHSLMAGFTARWEAGDLNFDEDELLEGGWFDIEALPQTPPPGTIAARLIATVKAEVLGSS